MNVGGTREAEAERRDASEKECECICYSRTRSCRYAPARAREAGGGKIPGFIRRVWKVPGRSEGARCAENPGRTGLEEHHTDWIVSRRIRVEGGRAQAQQEHAPLRLHLHRALPSALLFPPPRRPPAAAADASTPQQRRTSMRAAAPRGTRTRLAAGACAACAPAPAGTRTGTSTGTQTVARPRRETREAVVLYTAVLLAKARDVDGGRERRAGLAFEHDLTVARSTRSPMTGESLHESKGRVHVEAKARVVLQRSRNGRYREARVPYTVQDEPAGAGAGNNGRRAGAQNTHTNTATPPQERVKMSYSTVEHAPADQQLIASTTSRQSATIFSRAYIDSNAGRFLENDWIDPAALRDFLGQQIRGADASTDQNVDHPPRKLTDSRDQFIIPSTRVKIESVPASAPPASTALIKQEPQSAALDTLCSNPIKIRTPTESGQEILEILSDTDHSDTDSDLEVTAVLTRGASRSSSVAPVQMYSEDDCDDDLVESDTHWEDGFTSMVRFGSFQITRKTKSPTAIVIDLSDPKLLLRLPTCPLAPVDESDASPTVATTHIDERVIGSTSAMEMTRCNHRDNCDTHTTAVFASTLSQSVEECSLARNGKYHTSANRSSLQQLPGLKCWRLLTQRCLRLHLAYNWYHIQEEKHTNASDLRMYLSSGLDVSRLQTRQQRATPIRIWMRRWRDQFALESRGGLAIRGAGWECEAETNNDCEGGACASQFPNEGRPPTDLRARSRMKAGREPHSVPAKMRERNKPSIIQEARGSGRKRDGTGENLQRNGFTFGWWIKGVGKAMVVLSFAAPFEGSEWVAVSYKHSPHRPDLKQSESVTKSPHPLGPESKLNSEVLGCVSPGTKRIEIWLRRVFASKR
ncbi:hypothetical protein DFH08DRAFT_1040262 [Mycena albidolilacea]|uniref:Uncharacterized protein n=1 Tax=Mycena albidolilacea TaxID=1033008 RepID=A0AAD6ZBQ0_9AGAR|nr:hypothetical protein DFH08DRAFT_1040262 [Mycena albidolilacea]